MAHIKCHYTSWICTHYLGEDACSKEGYSCNDEPRSGGLGVCEFLDNYPCYLEKTSKNVEFDGDTLYVNRKYIASLGPEDYRYVPGIQEIDSLSIDGKEIIKDGCYVTEEDNDLE